MPRSNVIPLPIRYKQLSLVDIPPPEGPMPPLEEQVKSVPAFLELAIDFILADFDFKHANMSANTAKAVRILIIMNNRISKALENNHV